LEDRLKLLCLKIFTAKHPILPANIPIYTCEIICDAVAPVHGKPVCLAFDKLRGFIDHFNNDCSLLPFTIPAKHFASAFDSEIR
jgi:hypothetical protein